MHVTGGEIQIYKVVVYCTSKSAWNTRISYMYMYYDRT